MARGQWARFDTHKEGDSVKLELLKPWGIGAVGDVLPEVPKGVAEQLIKRGIAKVVDETKVQTKPFYRSKRK